MIQKKEALQLAIQYLEDISRKYLGLIERNNPAFNPNEEILYGERKGEVIATYTIGYKVVGGDDFDYEFITMTAQTGEVLYSISSTRWIEAYE